MKFAAAADMTAADEDLGHRSMPACARDHFGPATRVEQDVDLLETDTLLLQKRLCAVAKATEQGAIDFNVCHIAVRFAVDELPGYLSWQYRSWLSVLLAALNS
jgi:hypothetical protein